MTLQNEMGGWGDLEKTEDEARQKFLDQVNTKITLSGLLEECHKPSAAFKFEADPQYPGERMTLKIHSPPNIVPWDDFARLHDETWDIIRGGPIFARQSSFQSPKFSSFVLRSIGSECDIILFHKDTVERLVHRIITGLSKLEEYQEKFGLSNGQDFENSFHPGMTGCVSRIKNEWKCPAYAYLCRRPDDLPIPVLIAGLQEIQLDRESADKDPGSFAGAAGLIVTREITSLRQSMIDHGVRYGYICTGEAYLFLQIPHNDPPIVQYHLSIPNRDVADGDGAQFHHSAVAQVIFLALHAFKMPSPTQSWYSTTGGPKAWQIQMEYLSCDVPQAVDDATVCREYESLSQKLCLGQHYSLRSLPRSDGEPETDERGWVTRGYCTMACLRGMVTDGSLDRQCPNVQQHGSHQHPFGAEELLHRLGQQLDEDPDQEFEPLHITGSSGYMIKASLSSHGYTVVLKAVDKYATRYLEHEHEIYTYLQQLQGLDVPVCLGQLTPKRPYIYHGVQTVRMLALSWAGIRVDFGIVDYVDPEMDLDKQRMDCIERIQKAGIDVNCISWRNFLWNQELGRIITIDFERFKLPGQDNGGSKRKTY